MLLALAEKKWGGGGTLSFVSFTVLAMERAEADWQSESRQVTLHFHQSKKPPSPLIGIEEIDKIIYKLNKTKIFVNKYIHIYSEI